MLKPNSGITNIARTNFHGQSRLFGIKTDDRRRHMHIIGKTGMGKTSLLLNMAVSDIRNGHGLAFVDPHGDVADALLDYVPPERVEDVVYFNPQDLEYPIAFNVLGDVPKYQRHIVGDGLVGVFKKIWADSWGPRLEYILRNAILTLLENKDSTLLDIMRILVDANFRAKIVYELEDPILKDFWLGEFDGYTDKLLVEAISPIQNKVGQFTSSPLIRNIIGQPKSTIDIRRIMDERKILIMNLSKGAVGEGGAQLLGAMMITKMQLAAMSRVDILQEDRQDFFAYIDEFQNFSTDSFAEILSEARKYRLSLILAHQYIEQLSETVRGAVFGNVGTTIAFRIGATDAEFMEKEFAPVLTVEDLVNLPKWKIYLKLMIDGVTSQPFSADTLPDPEPELVSQRDAIIDFSRTTYGNKLSTLQGHSSQESTKEKPISNRTSNHSQTSSPQKKRDTKSQTTSQKHTPTPRMTQHKVHETVDNTSNGNVQSAVSADIVPPMDTQSLASESSTINSQNQIDMSDEVSQSVNNDGEGNKIAFANPVLSKKMREIFAYSQSPYGQGEYLVKAKYLKQLYTQNTEEKLPIPMFINEVLDEIRANLMIPKEPKEKKSQYHVSIKHPKR